jgi:hypothetical protein
MKLRARRIELVHDALQRCMTRSRTARAAVVGRATVAGWRCRDDGELNYLALRVALKLKTGVVVRLIWNRSKWKKIAMIPGAGRYSACAATVDALCQPATSLSVGTVVSLRKSVTERTRRALADGHWQPTTRPTSI